MCEGLKSWNTQTENLRPNLKYSFIIRWCIVLMNSLITDHFVNLIKLVFAFEKARLQIYPTLGSSSHPHFLLPPIGSYNFPSIICITNILSLYLITFIQFLFYNVSFLPSRFPPVLKSLSFLFY